MELVGVRNNSLLAYPRGRHEAMRADQGRVTVCVPVFQGEARLQRALSSLVSQTFRDFRVVVVDNNSSDGSFRIACQFARQHENFIAYQNPHNIGRVANWNRCLDLGMGEYVKLLTVNDTLEPEFLHRMVSAMDMDADVSVACCTPRVRREDGERAVPYFPNSRAMTGASALVHALGGGNLAGPASTQLWRRKPMIDHRLRFRADLGWAATFELVLHMLRVGDFIFVHDTLALFDEESPRNYTSASARTCFREEVEARLSVLRAAVPALRAWTLARTLGRVHDLYESYRGRAEEEGQERELDCDYSAVIVDLGDLLQRSTHSLLGKGDSEASRIGQRLAAAEKQVRAEQYREAESQLRDILAVAPYNLMALKDLGIVRYRQADVWGARKYLLSALNIDPNFDLVRLNLPEVIS